MQIRNELMIEVNKGPAHVDNSFVQIEGYKCLVS